MRSPVRHPEIAGGGWERVDAAVATSRADVAEAAPDEVTAAEGEAYVMRVLTACLNDAFTGHLTSQDGLSQSLAVRGGPNPDYRMMHAGLDPTRRYLLEGTLNASERVGIGVYGFGAGGGAELLAYTAFDRGNVDAAGRFAVGIAADSDGFGTLRMPEGARVVMMRILHRDPAGAPARLRLHGGPPVGGLALAQGSVAAALGQVANALIAGIRNFLEWSVVASAAVNSFHAVTPPMTQSITGDPDTVYFLGSFDLAEGAWLEVTVPAVPAGYWSLHAYNFWCESLPNAGIGDDRAVTDPDGRIRIGIAPDGAVTAVNKIHTLDRRRGVLIFRAIGTGELAVPTAVLRGGT